MNGKDKVKSVFSLSGEKCKGEHTEYQPTEEELKCPRCSSDNFLNSKQKVGYCTDFIHVDDTLFCYDCLLEISAKSFCSKLIELNTLYKCMHCNGTGYTTQIKR
jgi:hypothetical protein